VGCCTDRYGDDLTANFGAVLRSRTAGRSQSDFRTAALFRPGAACMAAEQYSARKGRISPWVRSVIERRFGSCRLRGSPLLVAMMAVENAPIGTERGGGISRWSWRRFSAGRRMGRSGRRNRGVDARVLDADIVARCWGWQFERPAAVRL
jgi:hypothetical protein